MNINQIMSELAQYIRMQEEAAAMVEHLKDQLKSQRPQNWQSWQSCTGHIWRRNPPPVYRRG